MASLEGSGRAVAATTPERADYEILTPERVSVRYDLAGVGSRGVAIALDTALQVVLCVALALLVVGLLALTRSSLSADEGFSPGAVAVGLLAVGLFGIIFGYYIVFELLWNGQTPGKRVMGLRAIRENGYPLRAGDAVVRNLVRLVDSLPTLYMVGLVTMLLNSRSKRLGDFAAGTIVVRERQTTDHPAARASASRQRGNAAEGGGPGLAATAQGVTPLRSALPRGGSPELAIAAGPEPLARLAAADATLVRDFLLRRSALAPRRRAELAGRLAASIADRYGLAAARAAAESDEAFLAGLV
jgi:uncharacterized RDD family membrane protein YckC